VGRDGRAGRDNEPFEDKYFHNGSKRQKEQNQQAAEAEGNSCKYWPKLFTKLLAAVMGKTNCDAPGRVIS